MSDTSAEQTAFLARKLQAIISPHLISELHQSQLFVDMADCYEACKCYIAVVDTLVLSARIERDEIESFLVDVDVHLLEHMSYHLNSLRDLLPKAIDSCDSDSKSE